MGPNSQRSKNKNTPFQGATRARFSNWRPPVSKPKGRGGDNNSIVHDVRNNGSNTSGISKPNGLYNNNHVPQKQNNMERRLGTSISVASSRTTSCLTESLPSWIDLSSIETIDIPQELLEKLLCDLGLVKEKETTKINQKELGTGIESLNIDTVNISNTVNTSNKTSCLTVSTPSTTSIKLKDRLSTILVYFQKLCFLSDDITRVYSLLKERWKTSDPISLVNEELYVALILDISKQPIPFLSTNIITVSSGLRQEKLESAMCNADLTDECDVLRSIYTTLNTDRQFVYLYNAACSILEVSFTKSDLSISNSNTSNGTSGGGDADQIVLTITFVIYNSDIYPKVGSLCGGWVTSPSNYISSSICFQVSIEAMEITKLTMLQHARPVAFDFIQVALDKVRLLLDNNHSNCNNSINMSQQQVKGLNIGTTNNNSKKSSNKLSAQSSISAGQSSSSINTASISSTATLPPAPTTTSIANISTTTTTAANKTTASAPTSKPIATVAMIERKYTNLPEYRVAMTQALNEGLSSGEAVRARALELVEYLLPQSALDGIAAEEASLENVRNHSYHFCQLGIRGEIEVTKQVMNITGMTKPQAKALMMRAKETMENENKVYTRDQNTMRQLWINGALQVLKQRQEKIQAKQIAPSLLVGSNNSTTNTEERKHKSRGPTIRAAMQLWVRNGQLSVVDREEDDADDDGDDENSGNNDNEDDDEDNTTSSSSFSDNVKNGMTNNFSMGQCVAAVRTEAKLREETLLETSNNTTGMSNNSNSNAVGNTSNLDSNNSSNNNSILRDKLLAVENQRLKRELDDKRRNKSYQDMLAIRQTLPAYMMREHLVDTIAKNRVVVVSGDTGCGKTTQIPQLVLDAAIDSDNGALVNLVVTQPRRISAVSVAERIALERVENLGQTAGYHIKLESKKSSKTRILLMTTGVLLRKLQITGDINDISHVFVDETHERDINTDFLLIVLKNLLHRRPDLKVILMSATLNAELFQNYFQQEGCACAMITIPGRTFPVTCYYLEHALDHTGLMIESSSEYAYRAGYDRRNNNDDDINKDPQKRRLAEKIRTKRLQNIRQQFTGKYTEQVLRSLEIVDESIVNTELVVALVKHIMKTSQVGAILVFVPGIAEIRDVTEAIRMDRELGSYNSSYNNSCNNTSNKTNNCNGGGSSNDDDSAYGGSTIGNNNSNNITKVNNTTVSTSKPIKQQIRVLPLHSTLSSHEQSKVFQTFSIESGIRKIVVSTNIAETSVTIPDVVYVIDTGRVKENRYDEISQFSVLEECWASQANSRQRSGRAGRVQPGICYRLLSSLTYQELPKHTTPEMLRLSLEELILQILALDLGDPYEFLESAISPPETLSIRNALRFLDNLSAVVVDKTIDSINNKINISNTTAALSTSSLKNTVVKNNLAATSTKSNSSNRNSTNINDESYVRLKSEITPLGFHLAALPVNPRIGKLILFGVLMGCADAMLIIAATISNKSPFVVPFDSGSNNNNNNGSKNGGISGKNSGGSGTTSGSEGRDRVDEAKAMFCYGDSDLLTGLNAFNAWKTVRDENRSNNNNNNTTTTNNNNNNNNNNKNYGKNNQSDTGASSSSSSVSTAAEERFCRENCLSLYTLQLIDQTRGQFFNLLCDIGFLSSTTVNLGNISMSYENRHGNDVGMLTAVLSASLAPNILRVPAAATGVKSIISNSSATNNNSSANGSNSSISNMQSSSKGASSTVTGGAGSSVVLSKKIAECCLLSKNGVMNIHPSSVMSDRTTIMSSYLVYLEAIRTSKLYVRDVSFIPPLALALFGGRLEVYEKLSIVTVEDWIAFRVSPELAKLFVALRSAIQQAFAEKVLDPQGLQLTQTSTSLTPSTTNGINDKNMINKNDNNDDNNDDDQEGNDKDDDANNESGRVRMSDQWKKALSAVEALVLHGDNSTSTKMITRDFNIMAKLKSTTTATTTTTTSTKTFTARHISSPSPNSSFHDNNDNNSNVNKIATTNNDDGKVGDWICMKCGVNNFASRSRCFKCSTAKLSSTSTLQTPPHTPSTVVVSSSTITPQGNPSAVKAVSVNSSSNTSNDSKVASNQALNGNHHVSVVKELSNIQKEEESTPQRNNNINNNINNNNNNTGRGNGRGRGRGRGGS